MPPRILMLVSAGIALLLGLIHLLYTFRGKQLHPRDASVRAAMEHAHMGLTQETTVWRAWIGFNASHSMGLILFGLVFGFLALFHADLLFGSIFLLAVGLTMLLGLLVLARAYWFSVPLAGVAISLASYIAGVIMARA